MHNLRGDYWNTVCVCNEINTPLSTSSVPIMQRYLHCSLLAGMWTSLVQNWGKSSPSRCTSPLCWNRTSCCKFTVYMTCSGMMDVAFLVGWPKMKKCGWDVTSWPSFFFHLGQTGPSSVIAAPGVSRQDHQQSHQKDSRLRGSASSVSTSPGQQTASASVCVQVCEVCRQTP